MAGFVPMHQPGVTVHDDWDGFGQRTTGTGTLIFDEARVDPRDVGSFDERIRYQTPLYQWILLVVQAGIAVAVERDIAEAVRNRTRNYSHSSAALAKDDPNIQSVVGEISTIAYTARALTRGSGGGVAAGLGDGHGRAGLGRRTARRTSWRRSAPSRRR